MISKAADTFQKHFPTLTGQMTLKDFQAEVINNLAEGHSSLAIMPTGGGKSLIYWVAAKAIGGICLVVSPLIALIDEQSRKLNSLGFSVLSIHAGMPASEKLKALKEFGTGKLNPDFIFVSPERIATDGFFEYCIKLRANDINLLVIDEVHCVSQWGFDFRPFYKRIPSFLNEIFKEKWPIILGLTATINPKELADISADFKILRRNIFKDKVLLRHDIELKVEKFSTEEEKEERLWDIIENHNSEKILIYLYRKYHVRGVEDLNKKAKERGLNSMSFHGDLSGGDRQDILDEFKSGTKNIVFATNAFGMGIDIPDIRVVIHFMLPESIEQYYQEIGRAGRDGDGAVSYTLFTNKNVQVRKTHYIDKSFPDIEEIKSLFTRATNNEINIKTLQYFYEEDLQSALPYFLNCGAIKILGKGFIDFKIFKNNKSTNLQKILDASKTGMVIPILTRETFKYFTCQDFFNIPYEALILDQVELIKHMDKCLLIQASETALTDQELSIIEKECEYKREYKHNLFDYLVFLLNNFESSKSMHQDIGRYLGINKHLLNKIFKTESGDWVRSKSEVIISNILKARGVDFKYEEKLFYNPTNWKEPDFTLRINGITYYWEHLGLLGDEEYNEDWIEKKEIFKQLGIFDRVITTTESAVLSSVANKIINKLTTNLPSN